MKFASILIVTTMVLPYFETADPEAMEEKEYEWAERQMNYLYTEGGIDYINGLQIQPHEFRSICKRARTQANLTWRYNVEPDFGLYKIQIVNANGSDLWNILRCPTGGNDVYVKRIAEGDTNASFVLYKKGAARAAQPSQGRTDGAGPSTVNVGK